MPNTVWNTFGLGTDDIAGSTIASRRGVVGVAVDFTHSKIWYRWSTDSTGDWNGAGSGTQNPATNTGGLSLPTGTLFPAFAGNNNASVKDAATLNTGATTFVMTIPSGFSAWDTGAGSTWNSGDAAANIVLSNGSLTATNSAAASGWQGVRGTSGKSSGLLYFEMTCDACDSNLVEDWIGGVANSTASLTNYTGATTNGTGSTQIGRVYFNAAATSIFNASTIFGLGACCYGSNSHSSGKYYFEIKVDALSAASSVLFGGGLCNSSITNLNPTSNNTLGADTNGIGFANSGTIQKNGNTGLTWTGGLVVGDILGIAVDFVNGAWGRKNNGAWSNSGNPVTGTGGATIPTGALFPAWSGGNTAGLLDQATLFTTSGGFTDTPPTGFQPWDVNIVTGAGEADGVASVAGVGVAAKTTAGEADGAASVIGTSLEAETAAGTANGVAQVAGFSPQAAGTANGQANVAGVGSPPGNRSGAGRADGRASVLGVGIGVLPVTGPVVWIGFYNIGDKQFCAALFSSGALYQIDLIIPNPLTQILPPGTVLNASSPIASPTVSGNTILGFAQFGSQYALFAKDQPNGYWIWDNRNTYTAGSLSPNVQLTAPGKNYTGPPTINVVTSGSGTGTSLIAALAPGTDYVEQVTFAAGGQGSGFGENDITAAYITGGGSDNQAMGRIFSNPGGGVRECVVINNGASYTYRAQAVFQPQAGDVGAPVYTGPDGNGMFSPGPGAATAVISVVNGQVQSITVTFPGQGYTEAPILTVNDPGYGTGATRVPGGTGFSGECNLEFGQCTGATPVSLGSGYTTPPTATIIGDGTGATCIVRINSAGELDLSHGDGGFQMVNFGSGYTKGFVICAGGNNAANITVTQMPFGISGTTIEVYQSRTWIGNGAAAGDQYSTPPLPPKDREIFSVAGDPSNFDPTQGAGAFRGNNSFLRVGYHALKQVNGFLYQLGDSSLDYISGVITQPSSIPGTNPPVAGPPTTTFNLQNSDPAIGSPWPSSAQIFNRKLIFANPLGVYEAPGGAARKISLPLDGFYNVKGELNVPGSNFSSAIATIFGVPVYMLLIPYTDLYSGVAVQKLVMWNGEQWFTSGQSKSLTFIATQQINSIFTAWATDGNTIFPLFQVPSTLFTKVVRSKLYGNPTYLSTKDTNSLHAIIQANIVDGQPVNLYVDSEQVGAAGPETVNVPIQVTPGTTQNTVVDQNGNSYLAPPTPVLNTVAGPVYGPITVGQQGRLIGFTVVTNASDLNLFSVGLAERVESPNV